MTSPMKKLSLAVLVVDDDEASLRALGGIVRAMGTRLTTAATLAEARACIAASLPDVLLADLHMPDGDGAELLGEVRGSGCEVIFVTGHADERGAENALRSGARAYLTKPVDVERLWAILEEIEERRAPA